MSEQETSPENQNDGTQDGDVAVTETDVANAGAESDAPSNEGEEGKDGGDLGGSLLQTAKDSSKDGKESEGKEGEETDEDSDKDEPEGAPESYEEFKAPEGVALDPVVMDAFSSVAKELNLPQAKAQEVIDKLTPILAQQEFERIKAVSKQWREKSETDKEIGGANHEKAMANVARVRDMFVTKDDADIAEFMASPAGNHPGVLKLLSRAGAALSEDGFIRSEDAGDTDPLSALYNKSNLK